MTGGGPEKLKQAALIGEKSIREVYEFARLPGKFDLLTKLVGDICGK